MNPSGPGAGPAGVPGGAPPGASLQMTDLLAQPAFLLSLVIGFGIVALFAGERFNRPAFSEKEVAPLSQIELRFLAPAFRYREGQRIYLLIMTGLYLFLSLLGPKLVDMTKGMLNSIPNMPTSGLPDIGNVNYWPFGVALLLTAISVLNDSSLLGQIEYRIRRLAQSFVYIPSEVRRLAEEIENSKLSQWERAQDQTAIRNLAKALPIGDSDLGITPNASGREGFEISISGTKVKLSDEQRLAFVRLLLMRDATLGIRLRAPPRPAAAETDDIFISAFHEKFRKVLDDLVSLHTANTNDTSRDGATEFSSLFTQNLADATRLGAMLLASAILFQTEGRRDFDNVTRAIGFESDITIRASRQVEYWTFVLSFGILSSGAASILLSFLLLLDNLGLMDCASTNIWKICIILDTEYHSGDIQFELIFQTWLAGTILFVSVFTVAFTMREAAIRRNEWEETAGARNILLLKAVSISFPIMIAFLIIIRDKIIAPELLKYISTYGIASFIYTALFLVALRTAARTCILTFEPGSSTLRNYLRSLRRQWKIIGASLLCGLMIGGLSTLFVNFLSYANSSQYFATSMAMWANGIDRDVYLRKRYSRELDDVALYAQAIPSFYISPFRFPGSNRFNDEKRASVIRDTLRDALMSEISTQLPAWRYYMRDPDSISNNDTCLMNRFNQTISISAQAPSQDQTKVPKKKGVDESTPEQPPGTSQPQSHSSSGPWSASLRDIVDNAAITLPIEASDVRAGSLRAIRILYNGWRTACLLVLAARDNNAFLENARENPVSEAKPNACPREGSPSLLPEGKEMLFGTREDLAPDPMSDTCPLATSSELSQRAKETLLISSPGVPFGRDRWQLILQSAVVSGILNAVLAVAFVSGAFFLRVRQLNLCVNKSDKRVLDRLRRQYNRDVEPSFIGLDDRTGGGTRPRKVVSFEEWMEIPTISLDGMTRLEAVQYSEYYSTVFPSGRTLG